MTEQIIYNLYSLFIQTCGILIALVAVYAFFRLGKITDLLIGQGLSVYNRQQEIHKKEIKNTPRLSEKLLERLRDAIDRKNIFGIEEALINITVDEYYNLKQHEKNEKGYYQHVLPKFIETKLHLKIIKRLSYIAIALLILTVLLCLISIVFTDYFYNNRYCLIIAYSCDSGHLILL